MRSPRGHPRRAAGRPPRRGRARIFSRRRPGIESRRGMRDIRRRPDGPRATAARRRARGRFFGGEAHLVIGEGHRPPDTRARTLAGQAVRDGLEDAGGTRANTRRRSSSRGIRPRGGAVRENRAAVPPRSRPRWPARPVTRETGSRPKATTSSRLQVARSTAGARDACRQRGLASGRRPRLFHHPHRRHRRLRGSRNRGHAPRAAFRPGVDHDRPRS